MNECWTNKEGKRNTEEHEFPFQEWLFLEWHSSFFILVPTVELILQLRLNQKILVEDSLNIDVMIFFETVQAFWKSVVNKKRKISKQNNVQSIMNNLKCISLLLDFIFCFHSK